MSANTVRSGHGSGAARHWTLPPFSGVALACLVAACLVVRIALWQVYQPVLHPDSYSYFALAKQIGAWDFSQYTGHRPPGYPILLLLTLSDPLVVWAVQALIGVAISAMTYVLALRCTGSVAIGFVAGLLHTLTLNQLFFEANILAETLTTFCILVSVLLVSHAASGSAKRWVWVAVGLASAAATLTRPQFVFLGPVYLVLLAVVTPRDQRVRLGFLLLAFAMPIVAWSAFNKATTGYFALTATTGIGLAQHASRFIEKAPDEFATLRDIYIDVRERRYGSAKPYHMGIWEAIPEMRTATGQSLAALAHDLARMSVWLFVHHPADYLRSVAEAWVSFWAAPNYWRPELIRSEPARRTLTTLWSLEQPALRAMNLMFVVTAVFVGLRALRDAGFRARRFPLLVLVAVVVASSVIQAAFEFSENPRYAIPTQSLALLALICVAHDIARGARRRRLASPISA